MEVIDQQDHAVPSPMKEQSTQIVTESDVISEAQAVSIDRNIPSIHTERKEPQSDFVDESMGKQEGIEMGISESEGSTSSDSEVHVLLDYIGTPT